MGEYGGSSVTRNLPRHDAQQLFSMVTVSEDSTKKVPAPLDILQNLPSAQVTAPHTLLLCLQRWSPAHAAPALLGKLMPGVKCHQFLLLIGAGGEYLRDGPRGNMVKGSLQRQRSGKGPSGLRKGLSFSDVAGVFPALQVGCPPPPPRK